MTKRFGRLLGCAAIISMSAARVQAAPAISSLPFETLSIGTRSGLTRAAKMTISTEAEWQRVRKITANGVAQSVEPPKVDFSRQIVVALMMGTQSHADAGIQIVQVVRGPRETLVYFADDKGTPSTPAMPAQAGPSQPFHFAVIDKPQSPLRFLNALGQSCTTCAGG